MKDKETYFVKGQVSPDIWENREPVFKKSSPVTNGLLPNSATLSFFPLSKCQRHWNWEVCSVHSGWTFCCTVSSSLKLLMWSLAMELVWPLQASLTFNKMSALPESGKSFRGLEIIADVDQAKRGEWFATLGNGRRLAKELIMKLMGGRIQRAPQKTLFRDAVMSGFILEFLPYFPTLITTYSWSNSFLECYVNSRKEIIGILRPTLHFPYSAAFFWCNTKEYDDEIKGSNLLK